MRPRSVGRGGMAEGIAVFGRVRYKLEVGFDVWSYE